MTAIIASPSRALASVRRISDLSSIPNADAIECARIDGWNVVVRKGEFQIGDPCVFCEIDSLLPEDNEHFEFMRARKFRVRTIRLRGQLSQGLAFPVDILEGHFGGYGYPSEGTDVTDLLGIRKYEPPMNPQLAGQARGSFPSFIPKTDETRAQNLQGLLTKYASTPMYLAEKLDGSSCTVWLKDGDFHVASRNLDLKETEGNSFWVMARKLELEEKLYELETLQGMKNFVFQGELIGGSIQGNRLKLSGLDFRIFNIFHIDTGTYLDYHDFANSCHRLGLPTVPILDDEFVLTDDIDTLLALADGPSALNPSCLREGIVIRPLEETNDARHGRLSFKCISNEYLLRTGG